MSEPILIAKSTTTGSVFPAANGQSPWFDYGRDRHEAVSLQALAQQFSDVDTPVFMADVKVIWQGFLQAGGDNEKVKTRAGRTWGCTGRLGRIAPTTLWDVFGEQGHPPVRATISDIGPLLLSRMLDLNDTIGRAHDGV